MDAMDRVEYLARQMETARHGVTYNPLLSFRTPRRAEYDSDSDDGGAVLGGALIGGADYMGPIPPDNEETWLAFKEAIKTSGYGEKLAQEILATPAFKAISNEEKKRIFDEMIKRAYYKYRGRAVLKQYGVTEAIPREMAYPPGATQRERDFKRTLRREGWLYKDPIHEEKDFTPDEKEELRIRTKNQEFYTAKGRRRTSSSSSSHSTPKRNAKGQFVKRR